MRYPHLFSRLYNTPLMLAPDKAMAIEEVFRAWAAGSGTAPTPEMIAAFEAGQMRTSLAAVMGAPKRFADKPYQMTDSGVAVIPVMGTLVQRASGMDAMSGMMSYAKIDQLYSAAQADPDVRGIITEYDTPGGEVSGLFTAVDRLMAARGDKPVFAYANEMAFSAGYALASTADKIYLPATAQVGSIGAVTMHVDQSKRDASQGYAYTLIQSGDRKTDGHSHAPLSDTAQAGVQAEIHRLRGMFADHVDAARGFDAGTAYGTEAAIYNAEQAVSNGLVDGIASFRDVIGMMEAEVSPKDATATFATTARQAGFTKEVHVTQAEAPAAGAVPQDITLQLTAAKAEGLKAGAESERARVGAILGLDEAKGREALAKTLALETDMNAETAKKLLSASPAQAAQAAGNPLAAAMGSIPNPKVGADAGTETLTPEAEASALALSIMSAGKPAKQ